MEFCIVLLPVSTILRNKSFICILHMFFKQSVQLSWCLPGILQWKSHTPGQTHSLVAIRTDFFYLFCIQMSFLNGHVTLAGTAPVKRNPLGLDRTSYPRSLLLTGFWNLNSMLIFHRKGHPNAHVFTSRTLDGSSADSPRSQFSINDWQNQRSCSATAWNLGTLTFGTACSMKQPGRSNLDAICRSILYTLKKVWPLWRKLSMAVPFRARPPNATMGCWIWRSFAGK